MLTSKSNLLPKIYTKLHKAFGPQHWWPGDAQIEIIVGAILTQNTNWGNVEKALNNLKAKKYLSPEALKDLPTQKLASLIKPAGYFNVKAKRLKNFIHFFFREFDGDFKKMKKLPWQDLRQKLLTVNGVGPETADSILLYAFKKPIFVVDAYTKRFLVRHNMVDSKADYYAIQDLFMNTLEHDVKLFNEYHALIVNLGKDFCKPKARCEDCVLNNVSYSLKHKCPTCHRALLPKVKTCESCNRSGR